MDFENFALIESKQEGDMGLYRRMNGEGAPYLICCTIRGEKTRMTFSDIVRAVDAWGALTRTCRSNPFLNPDVFEVVAWSRNDVREALAERNETIGAEVSDEEIDSVIDQLGSNLRDNCIMSGWNSINYAIEQLE